MIILNNLETTSPIVLTVILIFYLIIVELGNNRTRKALIPFITVLGLIFLIIAIKSIYLTYMGIK